MATAMLRMADAPVLPFEFGAPARTYRRYVDEIERLAKENDSTRALDLSAVRAALVRLDSAARRYEGALAPVEALTASESARRRRALAPVNRLLYQSEQALSDSGGLPRRPWYRHLIYAPGFYTGYGVKTMPGIREQVEQRDLAGAQAEAARVAAALTRYAGVVERAADGLTAALR
jgi:N-acetylated-alpha-linked acidic dipeptidase